MERNLSVFFLFCAVITCFIKQGRWMAITLGVSLAAAWWLGQVSFIGLFGCALVFTLAKFVGDQPVNTKPRAAAFVGLLAMTYALFEHRWPGFYNPRVFDHVRFTPDASPFTMYFNFDKTCAGLVLARFNVNVQHRRGAFLKTSVFAWLFLVAWLMPLALVGHYVAFEPKWIPAFWIWAINNLLFVCLAEEALYRAFIDGAWKRQLPGPIFSIVIGALLFGLDHRYGGWTYVGFAALAGLGYGYAYQKTNRLEASMLVHFAFNATHFLLFTYPALVAPTVG